MARRIRRGRRVSTVVPVASMGDIAFLLITFFIITSNFVKHQTRDLVLPVSADIEDIHDVPQIGVAIDQRGQIYLDGQLVSGGASALGSQLERMLVERHGEHTDLYKVLFQADEDLEDDVFQPVIQAIAEAGALIQMAGQDQ